MWRRVPVPRRTWPSDPRLKLARRVQPGEQLLDHTPHRPVDSPPQWKKTQNGQLGCLK